MLTTANRDLLRGGRPIAPLIGAAGLMTLVLAACASTAQRGSSVANQVMTLSSQSSPSTVSYDKGMIRFDPAPPNSQPRVSSADALAAAAKTGLYAGATKPGVPTLALDLYTDYGQGASPTDGTNALANVNRLSWVITYSGVADVGSGGGAVIPGQSISSPASVIHDIVFIVDASSGVVLGVLSDVPDASAYMTPVAPLPSDIQQAKLSATPAPT